jgi:hypothetical protein
MWAGVEALAKTLITRLEARLDEVEPDGLPEAALSGAEALRIMETALGCLSP